VIKRITKFFDKIFGWRIYYIRPKNHEQIVEWIENNLVGKTKIIPVWKPPPLSYICHYLIKIKKSSDAVLFKLRWAEILFDSPPPDYVILPTVRLVMPKIIANEIIGVQPMTGQTGQIFTLGSMDKKN